MRFRFIYCLLLFHFLVDTALSFLLFNFFGVYGSLSKSMAICRCSPVNHWQYVEVHSSLYQWQYIEVNQ